MNRPHPLRPFAALLAFLIGLTAASADTVTVASVGDAELRQNSPDFNLPNGTSLVAGTLGAPAGFEIRRGVFQFDLSGKIPVGSVISSASLRIVAVDRIPQSPANSTFDLRALRAAWTETEVTWNSRLAGVPWQVPGASGDQDSAPQASSSVFVTGLGPYTFNSTAALVADVQGWVNNPSSNFGWLLLTEAESTPRTARHFATREDPVNAPQLTIDFTPPVLGILTQPQSQTVPVGSTVQFSVTASGAPPLSFQWQFNGTPIPGATLDTLTLNNVQTNASGQYRVGVSNQNGSVTSQPATLTVQPPTPGAPFVSITSPTNGSRFPAGSSLLVTATAGESNGAITQVSFFLNTNVVGISTTSPYSVLVTNVPAGNDQLTAVAIDQSQVSVTSAVVRVSFLALPTITLSLLPSGTNLPVGVSITNTAVVGAGASVTNLEFLEDSTVLGVFTNPPFSVVVTPSAPGLFTFSAVALDEFGRGITSAPVILRIHIQESVPPTIAITSAPPNFARLTNSTIQIAGLASDNIGLDHVEFQVNSGPFLGKLGRILAAEGTSNWLATVTLLPGKNVVRIRSVDFSTNVSPTLSRFYTYTVLSQLTVETDGEGTVVPNLDAHMLEVGNVYHMIARAGPGQVFVRWEGVSNTNAANLNFEMQSNLVLVAHFAPNPLLANIGAYRGLIMDSNNVQPSTSAALTMQLGTHAAFSGKLTLEGANHPFHGKFGTNSAVVIPIQRTSLKPVVLAMQINSTGQLTGFMTNAAGTNVLLGTLLAEHKVFDARSNPAPQVGLRRFVLIRVSDQTIIGGGSSVVSTAGAVRFEGSLNDGRPFGVGSQLFADGSAPFYLNLSAGQEVIVGWVGFGSGAGQSISGGLTWAKSGTNGFSEPLQIAPEGL